MSAGGAKLSNVAPVRRQSWAARCAAPQHAQTALMHVLRTEVDAERWYERRRKMEIALAAVATNIVTILGVDDPNAPSLGTGFLVNVGGRVFVFTAGHNVGNESLPGATPRRSRVALQFYRRDLQLLAYPEKHIVAAWWRDIPGQRDVGVVELDPEDSVYWSHATPFTTEQLVDPFSAIGSPHDNLIFIGMPTELASPLPKQPAARLSVRVEGLAVEADHINVSDRGLAVGYEAGRSVDRYDSRTGEPSKPLPHPRGISGGPLLLVDRERRTGRVLGIARSYMPNDEVQFFEPVAHALELLVDHEDASVAADARATAARLNGAYVAARETATRAATPNVVK